MPHLPPSILALTALTLVACGGKQTGETRVADGADASTPSSSAPTLSLVLTSTTSTGAGGSVLRNQQIDVSAPEPPFCVGGEVQGSCCRYLPTPGPWRADGGVGPTPVPPADPDLGPLVLTDETTRTTLSTRPYDHATGIVGTGVASGYHSWEGLTASWTPTDVVGLTASGVSLQIRTPSTIAGLSPSFGSDVKLTEGHDFTVSWLPDAGAGASTVRLELVVRETIDTGNPSVVCEVPDSAGRVSVPGSLLAFDRFPHSGDLRVTRAAKAVTTPGDASPRVEVSAYEATFTTFFTSLACTTNAECAGGVCLCSTCVAKGSCESDGDCAANEYCDRTSSTNAGAGCSIHQCSSLGPPVSCGSTSCTARAPQAGINDYPTAACCPPNGGDVCGLQVGSILLTNDPCQPLGQPAGTPDPTCDFCPTCTPKGCRRPDGHCGADLGALGLGCVASLGGLSSP